MTSIVSFVLTVILRGRCHYRRGGAQRLRSGKEKDRQQRAGQSGTLRPWSLPAPTQIPLGMTSFLTPLLQSHSVEGLSVHSASPPVKWGWGVRPVSDPLLASTSGIPAQPILGLPAGLVWFEPSPFHKGTTPEMLTDTLSRWGGKFFCSLRTFWVRQEPVEAKEEVPVCLPPSGDITLPCFVAEPAGHRPAHPLGAPHSAAAPKGLTKGAGLCSRNRKC